MLLGLRLLGDQQVPQVMQQACSDRFRGFTRLLGQVGTLKRMIELAHGFHTVLAYPSMGEQVINIGQGQGHVHLKQTSDEFAPTTGRSR
jgi:hypothetical protein